jgi:cell division protein FtsB
MGESRGMAASRTAASPTPRARARPRATARPPRVRWDRLGRIALLFVLAMLLYLYIGPARSYLAAVQESKQRRAEVTRLERENARLRARKAALNRPATVEMEARRLGMVRPGERSYILRGLPGG